MVLILNFKSQGVFAMKKFMLGLMAACALLTTFVLTGHALQSHSESAEFQVSEVRVGM